MTKYRKAIHQPFESSTENGRFVKICHDMLNGEAGKNLSLRQWGLYLMIKSKYTQKMSNGRMITNNARYITFTITEALTKYGYGDKRTFLSDIDRLIEYGFIDLIESGHYTRNPNIYGFSTRWKKFGQSDYEIPAELRRKSGN